MLADVVLLRAKGQRLKRRELQPPTRGTLSIKCDDGQGSFKRPLLVARLWVEQSSLRLRSDVLLPLFDARLVILEDGVLTVSGIELGYVENGVVESGQVWRCTPVLDPNKAPAR